jgi:phosphoribosyl 1,2-cyclic phosphate phosphodiesterase
MRIRILGCGPSQGVPVVGNRWGDCDPTNEKNYRSRPSIVIEYLGKRVLVDMTPDVRTQLLDNEISSIDAVLFTHLHYDHVGGIGELRTLSQLAKRRLNVYATPEVLDGLSKNASSSYLFKAAASDSSHIYKPSAKPVPITYGTVFDAAGMHVLPFMQDHGICETAGFRIGNFAYSTDAVELNEAAFDALEGIDLWIVDCLRKDPHPTHAHFDRTLGWIERVKPKRAVFTHMNFQSDYEQTLALCPEGVEPGYDGMILEVC